MSQNFKLVKIFNHKIIYITPGQTFFGVLKYTFFIILSSILNKQLIIHVHGNYLRKEYNSLSGFKRGVFYFLLSRFSKGILLSVSLKENLIPFIDESKIFIVKNNLLDVIKVTPTYFSETKVVLKNIPDGTVILTNPFPGAYAGMMVNPLQSKKENL